MKTHTVVELSSVYFSLRMENISHTLDFHYWKHLFSNKPLQKHKCQ